MKQRILPQSLILPSLCICSAVNAFLSGMSVADEKKQSDDIKPALASIPKAKIDAEQMRLVKATHKRIMERLAREKGEFKAYTDKMKAGVKIDMVPVKTQPFVWKGEAEGDVLEVTLGDFWMASKETSWAAYDAFEKEVDVSIMREKDGSVSRIIRPQIKDDFVLLARPTPQYWDITWGMGKTGYNAVAMTHHAANKFCQWLSYQTGHFYRLPTEAEWEYACRGGSRHTYSWGDEPKRANQFGWFGGKEDQPYHKGGLKKPNGFGLYDMHGNVLEWTLDGYVKNRRKHFNKAKVHNPWVKAVQPYPHVTKGGHWKHPLEKIVASARIPSTPQWKRSDCQDPKSIWSLDDAPFVGFRVVRPVKIPTAEEMYHYWNSGTEYDGQMAFYH